VGSKQGPLRTTANSGLLYMPRVIVRLENLWNEDWQGKPKYSEKNLPQRHFVQHKSHLTRPEREPGPPRWEAND
jgi:hypothetical protein